MEGPKQLAITETHRQTLSERVAEFRQHKTWDNFKAIFLGRTISIVTKVEKQIPTSDDTDIGKDRLPPRAVSKAEEVTRYVPQTVPENEPAPAGVKYEAKSPEPSHSEALKMVKVGDFGQLTSVFRDITDEDHFIALRNYLMEHGALYNCTDDLGHHRDGVEEIVREASVRFDGPVTRCFKKTPYLPAQSQPLTLDEQLRAEFSDADDFQNLCDTLYNDGYFSQPTIVAAIQQHSRRFDSSEVQKAKDLVADYKNDPTAFQQHVEAHFTTVLALQELRDNLYDHAFLVEEMLHGFTLDSSQKVLPYLNQRINDLEEAKINHDKVDMLKSNDSAAVRNWLKTAAASREDAAWLLSKAQSNDGSSDQASSQLQAHYKHLVDKEIVAPMLEAGQKFAESEACAAARKEYEALELPGDKARQRELQIQLATDSPELKQMMQQLSRDISIPGQKGQVSSQASLEELSRLEEAIEDSDLEPMAKDVTRRAMFLAREVVTSALYEKMMLLLNSGDLKSLGEEFMQLAHLEDCKTLEDGMKEALKSQYNEGKIDRNEYITISRQLLHVVNRTRLKLFPQQPSPAP